MATNIPFPNIPNYPGVPALVRPIGYAIAENPILAIGLGSAENILIQALQQSPQWGIFDQLGNQVGIAPNSQTTLQALEGALASQITGSIAPQLSTLSLEFMKESRVSDFPLEQGGFASYNKVQTPASPVVTLILQGQESDRTYLLQAIDAACTSTNLYNVVTPTVNYQNYTVERYSYTRKSDRGLTLLIVEVALKEIRQVTPAYSTSPIVAPVNPAASQQVSGGTVQPAPVPQSALSSLYGGLQTIQAKVLGGP
jgi:hypothetical protein